MARVNLLNNGSNMAIMTVFLKGKNHLDDLGDMVWLFRNFNQVSFMKHAIQLWKEADGIIAKLNSTGHQTNLKIVSGSLSEAEREEILSSINQLNFELTKKE